MTTYNYTGLTAFIRNTPETNEAFRVLAEAIPQLKAFTGQHDESFELFDGVMNSEAFLFIAANNEILSPCMSMLPNYTPKEYMKAELTSVEINGVHMTRMYIPAAAQTTEFVKHMTHESIRPVLMALFGENLVGIKTKSASENEEFHLAKEVVLLSAQRRAAVA